MNYILTPCQPKAGIDCKNEVLLELVDADYSRPIVCKCYISRNSKFKHGKYEN